MSLLPKGAVWRLTLAFALAGLALPASALASPLNLNKHALDQKQCNPAGAHSTQLVDVHYTLVNDYDSGFAGNAWANDTIQRHLRIWSLPEGTYCAAVDDHGSFVTFAGPSPSGSGATVDAGVKGTIDGGYVTTFFTGTYAATLPTHGDLGTFDLGCTGTDAYNYTCLGDHPSYLSYFSSTAGYDQAFWGWIYHAGKHGTWLNQLGVDATAGGDIT